MNTKVFSTVVCLVGLSAFQLNIAHAALPTAIAQGTSQAQSASFDGVVEGTVEFCHLVEGVNLLHCIFF